jgi:hypothetical protein
MTSPRVRAERLVALALLGFLLFNYPLLALFDRRATLAGIPVLYLYLFGAGVVVVGLMAAFVRRPKRGG